MIDLISRHLKKIMNLGCKDYYILPLEYDYDSMHNEQIYASCY